MPVHLQREMERLKKKLLGLSAFVEENLLLALRSLEERDRALAEEVRARDLQVDRMEVEIEEDCLKILALHQPVAIDLRFVVAVLKINNDLERIGDQAVNIANKVKAIGERGEVLAVVDLRLILMKARRMLREALDSLVRMDVALARAVCAADDEVDTLKREAREKVEAALRATPERAASLLSALGAVRNLERIADLSTNIAEDVLYMAEGRIVRHRDGRPPEAEAEGE
ncbi:MAG: phosphate signaling complex protein PhoU [Planctomycetota bacterium]